MTNKTVTIILVINALLFAFILLVERNTMTTAQRSARSENVFFDFRPDKISQIEIQGSEKKITLVKSGSASTGGQSLWKITTPIKYSADSVQVKELISAMDYLLVDRKVTRSVTGKKFGFETPQLRAKVKLGSGGFSFKIGAFADKKRNVYLAVDNITDHFFVVDASFLKAFNKDLNQLRDKQLMSVLPASVTAVSVFKKGREQLQLVRNRDGWITRIDNISVPVRYQSAMEIVNKLTGMEAFSFVDGNNIKDAKVQLEQPEFIVNLTLKTGKKVKIVIGGNCKNDTVYLSVDNQKSIQCVDKSVVEQLNFLPERYAEKKVAQFKDTDVTSFTIKKSDASLSVKMDKESLWQAGSLTTDETGQMRVAVFLEQLCAISGSEIITSKEIIDNPGVLTVSLTAVLADQNRHRLDFYSSDEHGVLVLRDKKGPMIAVDKSAIEKFVPREEQFRNPVIKNYDNGLPEKIVITGAIPQTLNKNGEHWFISRPVAAVAGMHDIHKIIEMLKETHVEKYVAPGDSFGFKTPYATIALYLAKKETGSNGVVVQTGSQKVKMIIGNLTGEDNRFATIEGENLVFTISQKFWSLVSRPLAALSALQINSGRITRIEVVTPSDSFVANLDNEEWSSKECSIDNVQMGRAVIDLAVVKAVSAESFGDDIGTEQLRLKLFSDKDDSMAELIFGSDDPDGNTCLAKRSDLKIIYKVPMRVVKKFQTLCR